MSTSTDPGPEPERFTLSEPWSGHGGLATPPDAYITPLPDRLAEKLEDAARAEHERICSLYGESREALAKLDVAVAEAERADEQKEYEAAVAGEPVPKPSAAKLEERREQERRRLAMLAAGVRESASSLVHELDEATLVACITETEDAEQQLLGQLGQHLTAAEALLSEIADERGQRQWFGRLRHDRTSRPWGQYGNRDSLGHVESAVVQVREQLRREEERSRKRFRTGGPTELLDATDPRLRRGGKAETEQAEAEAAG